MASEEPEAAEIQPEQPAGISEEIADRQDLGNLDEELKRMLSRIQQYEVSPATLDRERKYIVSRLDRLGASSDQLGAVVQTLVGDQPNTERTMNTVQQVFNSLKVKKQKEIKSDEQREAAGDVKQGGEEVDVQQAGAGAAPAPRKLGGTAQAAYNTVYNMLTEIQQKLYVDGEASKGYTTAIQSVQAGRVSKRKKAINSLQDIAELEEIVATGQKLMNDTTNPQYVEEIQKWLSTFAQTKDQRDQLKPIFNTGPVSILLGISDAAPGGFSAKKVSGAVPKIVQPGFSRRFKLIKKKFKEDARGLSVFNKTFDSYMAKASGAGMGTTQMKNFLKENGSDAVRTLAKVFVPGDLSGLTDAQVVKAITQAEKLNKLVADARDTNPGDMRRLMEHGALRKVLGNPGSASPPSGTIEEAQEQLARDGMVAPAARKRSRSAGDVVDMIQPAPKRGRPANVRARGDAPFGWRQFQKAVKDGSDINASQAKKLFDSYFGSEHRADTVKLGKAAADVNRYMKVVGVLTGTGGRTGRSKILEGPLHPGNHVIVKGDNVHKYPRTINNENEIVSLMNALAQEYRVKVQSKRGDTLPTYESAHDMSSSERAQVFNMLEQSLDLKTVPSFWKEMMDERGTADKRKLAEDVKRLWSSITSARADDGAPLSYMSMMQKYAHEVAHLDRELERIHYPKAKVAPDRGAFIQRQHDSLLPVAVKLAKEASIKYDELQGKDTDLLKAAYTPRKTRQITVPRRGPSRSARSLNIFGSPQYVSRDMSPEPDQADDEKAEPGALVPPQARQPPPAAAVAAMGALGAPRANQGGRRPLRLRLPRRRRAAPAAPVVAPVVQDPAHPVNRDIQRTHLYVNPTANIWQSTGYRRSIGGDMMPPETGRVHLVRPGDLADPMEHFMRGMEPTADSNMGRKKAGPFKHSKGRSLVMSRSRFTHVRKRNDALEITIDRGVTPKEVDSVLARLTSHRLAAHSTLVYLVVGSKTLKLGKLASIDIDKLRRKLHALLAKNRSVGLQIVDEGPQGPMFRHAAHNYSNVKIASGF